MIKPSILTVLQREGVELRRKGKAFWGLCPLHSEKTPSFKVSPEKEVFYCFGCGAGGDVISFVMKLHNLTFIEALKYLNIKENPKNKERIKQLLAQKEKERKLKKAFEKWKQRYYNDLCLTYRVFHKVLPTLKNMEEVEKLADLYHEMPLIEHKLDILTTGTEAEKIRLFQAEVTDARKF